MEALSHCPVCDNDQFQLFKKIVDHFLTKEEFQVVQCNNCGFLFTNPRPAQSEISRYYQSDEYISHNKNKVGWLSSVYNIVRNISLYRKYKLIAKHKTASKILDIGCGTGDFLHFMKKKGWEVTGIEPADSPRGFALQNYNIDVFDEKELPHLPFGNFDVITLWHVLEHVPDLNLLIKQIKNLLKSDGLLVVALPNHESWDAGHYQTFWAAWDVPRHFYHFSKKTFSLIIKNHQLKIISSHPMKFDAFYISLLSEKYKHVKPGFIHALINGMRSNQSAKQNLNNYSSLVFLIKHQNI
ncbi:MAG: class I SAM-dependent methyltransferase [Bacteroidales bacterium]|nr:class I SAM-dependent methyltransferase [Bacteroidales bacterium]